MVNFQIMKPLNVYSILNRQFQRFYLTISSCLAPKYLAYITELYYNIFQVLLIFSNDPFNKQIHH